MAAEGITEVTLLGQNVNSYGRDLTLANRSAEVDDLLRHTTGAGWADGDRRARPLFADLLRSIGEIEGIRRVRYTSPHPKDLRPETIAAMAEVPTVCEHLHLPLQSGSDAVLSAMHRGYTAQRYLEKLAHARATVDDLAVTTDIIVGFPGETEEDFAATLDVVRRARFSAAFTFQYSRRPGTPAAELDGQLPKSVVQERYQRLIDLQQSISLEENTALIGTPVEVLVATGEGRKDAATARMTGRARDGRLVHFAPGKAEVRPGDVLCTTVTGAAPHHLIADAPLLSHRRTRAGDAHAAGRRPRTVGLGLPPVGAPPADTQTPTTGCAR